MENKKNEVAGKTATSLMENEQSKPSLMEKEAERKETSAVTTELKKKVEEVEDSPEITESELKEKLSSSLSYLGGEPDKIPTKTVIIKATPGFVVTPKGVESEAYTIIGAPLVGRAPYIPLNADELVQVAGKIFGHTTASTDFDAKLMEYFSNFRVKIEYGPEKEDGKKLVLPINEKGEVIFHKNFVDDIITYRVCLKTKKVAKTPPEVMEATSGDSNFVAYLFDASQERTVERRLAGVKKEAEKNFLILVERPKELNWIVRLLKKGVPVSGGEVFKPSDSDLTIDSMTQDDKENAVRELRDKHPGVLNSLMKDPNLEMRADIETAIDLGFITNSKGVIKYGEEVLGSTIDEAIDELKKPRRSDLLINLKGSIGNPVTV